MIKAETLAGGTRVYSGGAHTFGADSLLLSDFCAPRPDEKVCDLGTGCGILPLRWHDGGHRGPVLAVEIQDEAADLFARAIEENDIDHITLLRGDLRALPLPAGAFDAVASNPPYFSGGRESVQAARAAARHQGFCTTEDICRAAARLLRGGGRLCLCQRPENLAGVLCAMSARGITPKALQFVRRRAGDIPWLFLARGTLGGGPGLSLLPDFIMEDDGGRPTPEMNKVYRNEETQ